MYQHIKAIYQYESISTSRLFIYTPVSAHQGYLSVWKYQHIKAIYQWQILSEEILIFCEHLLSEYSDKLTIVGVERGISELRNDIDKIEKTVRRSITMNEYSRLVPQANSARGFLNSRKVTDLYVVRKKKENSLFFADCSWCMAW